MCPVERYVKSLTSVNCGLLSVVLTILHLYTYKKTRTHDY